VLADPDIRATNTLSRPDRIQPRTVDTGSVTDGRLIVHLPADLLERHQAPPRELTFTLDSAAPGRGRRTDPGGEGESTDRGVRGGL